MSDGDSGSGDHIPDDEVIITVPADMHAGVWANWARVNEGDDAFRESRASGQPSCVRSENQQ